MNFGQTIKNEIINRPIKDDEEKKYFLLGIIRGAGSLFSKDDEIGLDINLSDELTAITVSNYLNTLFNYEVREVSVTEDRLNKKDKFVLSVVGDGALEVLELLKIVVPDEDGAKVNFDFYGDALKDERYFKAFIRGLFISSGVCTVPDFENDKTKYHLELSFSHNNTALSTLEQLEKFGIKSKITRRKDEFIVYIKSAEEIKDFLAFLPVPVSVIKLSDVIVKREFINEVNRRKNCDLGNVNRQIEASRKVLNAIEKIQKTAGLDSLKDDLYIVAKARQNNPEETMQELADRLNISKSCLNHRLRKIISIANEEE